MPFPTSKVWIEFFQCILGGGEVELRCAYFRKAPLLRHISPLGTIKGIFSLFIFLIWNLKFFLNHVIKNKFPDFLSPDTASSTVYIFSSYSYKWRRREGYYCRGKTTLVPWANLTLIILFWEFCWKFQKIFLPNQKILWRKHSGYLRIFHLLKWMFQN